MSINHDSTDWYDDFKILQSRVGVDFYKNLEVPMRKKFNPTDACFFKEVYIATKSKKPSDGYVLKDREWWWEHHGLSESNIRTSYKNLNGAGLMEKSNRAGNRAHWKINPRAVIDMFLSDAGTVESTSLPERLDPPIRTVRSTDQNGEIHRTHKEREGKRKESVAHGSFNSSSYNLARNEIPNPDNPTPVSLRDSETEEPAWVAEIVPTFERQLEKKSLAPLTDKERETFRDQFAQLHRDHDLDRDTTRAMFKRMLVRWESYRLPPVSAYEDVTVDYPGKYPPMSKEQFEAWRDNSEAGEDAGVPQETEWRVDGAGIVYSRTVGIANSETRPLLSRWEYPSGAPDWVNEKLDEIYEREEREEQEMMRQDETPEEPTPDPEPVKLVVDGLPVDAPDGFTYEQWEDYKREAAAHIERLQAEPMVKNLPPISADGIYHHGPECACWLCEEDAPEFVPESSAKPALTAVA